MPDIYIFPEDKSGRGGGGPEDDPRYPAKALRTNGFSVLAFAVALAITFTLFFGIVEVFLLPEIPTPNNQIEDGFIRFINAVEPHEWPSYLLYGFFAGVAIAGVYNLLMVKRLNIFGLESSAD